MVKTCLKNKCVFTLILFSGILSVAGCSNNPQPEEHPEFVNMLHKKMDTTQYKDLEQAFLFIDSAFKTLKHPGIGDIYTKDSVYQYYYGIMKKDPLRSIAYADSLLILLKDKLSDEKYAERYATVLFTKGESYLDLYKYSDALDLISQAEDITIKYVKNKCGVVDYNAKKANIMFAQAKYLDAAFYYTKQYRFLLSNCKEGYRQLMQMEGSLNNTAICYIRAGLLDSADWCHNEALKIIAVAMEKYPGNNHNTLYGKAVINGDQAESLALRGKYDEAVVLYKKSMKGTIAEDTRYIQSVQGRLADAYLSNHKTDSALLVLNELKISLDTFQNENESLKWRKLKTEYFTQVHKLDSAFVYQQQHDDQRDSMLERDKNFNATDFSKTFENLELKYSNEVLQKEGKLKNLYLIIAIVTFFAVTAITFFVWYNWRRIRKLHYEVAQKNDALQTALVSLEQSHEENNRISRIVAHDLKNPVSAINNLIFSLMRKNYPEELKEIFQVIKTACSNSMVLINDILNQNKSKTAIRTEQVEMKRLLEYCVSLLQAKAIEKNQFLTLQAEDVLVMLNRQKMWRVVSNIINNAIKFSPEHSSIEVKLQRRHDRAILSVHDNGIGIPENLKDKIFSMSPEASRPGTFGEESYGLGLTISQKIIEEHNGKIWFDSNNGKGSVFYVELPCLN